MGKASREKRERRDEDEGSGSGSGSGLPRIEVPRERRSLPVFWIAIAVIVVGGIAAVFLTAPDQSTKERVDAVADAPVAADVEVSGENLATWRGSGTDPAVGSEVPVISGTTLDGVRTTFAPDGSSGRAYVVMAHWCQHCQAEIPRIVEWAKDNPLPSGVEIVGISTHAEKGQSNYPPAEWLAREEWSFPTMVDDEIRSAALALGTEGYPFMVFTDQHGKVVERYSGEMPIEDFAAAIEKITAPQS